MVAMETGFANNSYSVVKQFAELSKFMPLDDQPEFAFEFKGDMLIGKLTGNVNTPVQWQLVVEFNNGVTDIFYLSSPGSKEWWASDKKNTGYAKAITKKLDKLFDENYSKFRH